MMPTVNSGASEGDLTEIEETVKSLKRTESREKLVKMIVPLQDDSAFWHKFMYICLGLVYRYQDRLCSLDPKQMICLRKVMLSGPKRYSKNIEEIFYVEIISDNAPERRTILDRLASIQAKFCTGTPRKPSFVLVIGDMPTFKMPFEEWYEFILSQNLDLCKWMIPLP